MDWLEIYNLVSCGPGVKKTTSSSLPELLIVTLNLYSTK